MTKRSFAAPHISRGQAIPAILAIVAGALMTMVGPPAAAQFGEEAADHRALQLYQEGETAYTEGRYEAAVRSFTAAHRLSPRPLLLYNLANAYERLGRYAEAVQTLEEYLPDAPIDERAVLQTRLENLRLRLSGAAPSGSEEPEPGPAGVSPVAPTASPEPAAMDQSGGEPLFVPGVALTAGGLALVGAGVAFGVLALDARGSLEGPDAGCGATPDGRSLCLVGTEGAFADAELFALLADVGMIGGGVITAVGLGLMIVGALGDSDGEASQMTWTPELRVGPTGASVGARGRF